MTRALLVAFALLAFPALASAQLTVLSTTPQGATTDVVVDGDLAVATTMLSANADAQLRQAAPQIYAPVDLGVMRYSDTTTVVDSIAWRRISDTELGVTVHAHVRAAQEHRTLSLAWARDGVVNLANVVLDARVVPTFTTTGGVHVSVLGNSIAISPQVTGLSAIGEQAIALNGQQLGERTMNENPLASRHLRGTAMVITGVEPTTVHARISAVPAT